MAAAEHKIPRVIHRIWLGPDPVPDEFESYAESWRRHHPEWELRLWRDEDLPELSCAAQIGRTRRFKAIYDMTRLELLRQMGGVVIDLDVEALRPIDPLLEGVTAFVGRTSSGNRVGNQVIGAVARHPLLEHAIERLDDTAGKATNSSEEAGPAFLSRVVNEKPDGVAVYPRDYFYSPLTIEPPEDPDRFPSIYAVHHSTESYRPGPEGQIVRLERQLRKAQQEILRLQLIVGEGPEVAPKVADAQRRLQMVSASRWWRLGRRLGIVKLDG
jgi:inositol phosphorylceramide mannosyltransferase catalytic subunit